ncbi:MAG: membrane protein insertase YidC [Lachnospiraceae bacterium]|nr:membrane protein insertase YidC [Lachnospiraceae bacterium]
MFADLLYAIIIYPLEIFIETVFSVSMNMIGNAGYAIIFVSIAVQLLALPMYKRADEIQEQDRLKQKELSRWIGHIKKTFKGDEQLMVLSEYYRQNDYQPWYSLRGMLPLLLQIPFFIAAYHFLSNCETLNGASFYFLRDMGTPDALLNAGGISVNVLPVLMTVINLVSGIIYTKGLPLKDKLQLFITAGVFLILLYNSPSGLVFYWTLNNVFSLMKNVFMKVVKHPRGILCVISILFVSAVCGKCFMNGAWQKENGILVMVIVFALGCIPAAELILDRFRSRRGRDKTPKTCISAAAKTIFRISSVSIAVLLGVMIPAATIDSSPTEFIIRGHYVSPLVQLIYTSCVAAGLFVLWGNLVFFFASEKSKKILFFLMVSGTVCALADFVFFKQHLNNMSMHMQYYDTFFYSVREILINSGILLFICILLFLLVRFNEKLLQALNYIILVSVTAMSVYLAADIQRVINNTSHIKDDSYYTESDVHFDLDKKGKNVVIFMLDRAFGQYVPYIINEKPGIAETFSGFTYYPNTISFGTNTAEGAPPIFGGYEYSTYNISKRSSEKVSDIQNESLKVLPRIFSENGYKCTVLDPPYYIDLTRKTLEEYYHDIDPDINARYADGVVMTAGEAERDFKYFTHAARINYIRHSIFIASPLLARSLLYDDGSYLMQERIDDRITYSGHKQELEKLWDMTNITESADNTFTVIENDLTHSINIDLQLPDYTQTDDVDNSEFMEEWTWHLSDTDKNIGRDINMYTANQIQTYQVNMSAFLSIGKWIDQLKQNGLYDNTRIILVADHGYWLRAFDDMLYDKDGIVMDLDMFTPLLMVKDFGDGDFETSNEFMTNADVPSLAMKDLIKDPVNPYTGKSINSDQKKDRLQFVYGIDHWYGIHDDIYDMKNWDMVDDEVQSK